MTKKLLIILISLLILLGSFILIKKYNILEEIKKIIYYSNTSQIIIPNSTVNDRNYNYLTYKSTNNFYPKSKEDIKQIYYTVINNGWDEFTFYCPYEYKTCEQDIKKLITDDDFIATLNNYVSPYNSFIHINTYIIASKEVYLKIEKIYTKEEIENLNNEINNILEENSITGNSINDIKKIHRYIINNTAYDSTYKKENITDPSNKATGALFNKKAVCSGYADLFSIMMDRINVPNFKVSSENHIWNVVYVDGKWLHIDSTWDDDEMNPDNQENFLMIDTDKLYELDKTEHTFDINLYKELKSE